MTPGYPNNGHFKKKPFLWRFFLKQTTFFVFLKKTKKTPAMELVNGHPSMLESFRSAHRPILESQRCMITMRLLLKSRTPPPQGGWVGGCPHPPSSGVRFSHVPVFHVFCAAGENKLKIPPPPRGEGATPTVPWVTFPPFWPFRPFGPPWPANCGRAFLHWNHGLPWPDLSFWVPYPAWVLRTPCLWK